MKLARAEWDRTGAVLATALGVALVIAGWVGVSGQSYVAKQLPYIISGGVGGILLVAIGATLWISADLRDEWRKLDRMEEAMREGTLRWVDDPVPAEGAPRDWDALTNRDPVSVGAGTNGTRPRAVEVPKAPAPAPAAVRRTKTTESAPRKRKVAGSEA